MIMGENKQGRNNNARVQQQQNSFSKKANPKINKKAKIPLIHRMTARKTIKLPNTFDPFSPKLQSLVSFWMTWVDIVD